MSVPGMLFLVFLVLKLTSLISWSWWAVTAPLWISALLGMGICVVLLVIAIVAIFLGKTLNVSFKLPRF